MFLGDIMFKRLICSILIFSLSAPSLCFAEERADCSAAAAAVCDASSGKILYAKNGRKKLGMASTTKIMTALCALKYGEADSVATVSQKAASVEGSSMYLKPGEKLKLSDLVTGLMLVSGNDAATAIAEHISGSEGGFVMLMNQTANEIGAKNTCFQNPHGLSLDTHYTTAFDLAKIAAYAMKNPEFEKIVSTKSAVITTLGGEKKYLVNHNKLLRLYDGCIGIKTGFTKAVGRCLVTCARRNGLILVCVTLNDGNDWQDHINLYNRAFEEYDAKEYIKKGTVLGNAKIYGGEEKKVRLVAKHGVSVAVKKGEKGDFGISAKEKISLNAPVLSEETEIVFDITENGKKIGEVIASPGKDIKKSAKGKKKLKADRKSFFKRLFKK